MAKYETGNIFYSPFSIHVIMFMASVGAASKTFDEITAIIHLNKNNHSMEAYKILLENLTMVTVYNIWDIYKYIFVCKCIKCCTIIH